MIFVCSDGDTSDIKRMECQPDAFLDVGIYEGSLFGGSLDRNDAADPSDPPALPQSFPSQWRATLDPNTLTVYYYHLETEETTWFR